MDDLNRLLQGRSALVTGGGANIGRAIVLEMARHGATVYFVEKNRARCSAVESELKLISPAGKGFVADISKKDELDQLYADLQNEGIIIDLLVNNAGIEYRERENLGEMWNRWQNTFDTNVIGPYYLTQLVIQNLKARETAGAVIFITSIHQWVISPATDYAASKAALGGIIPQLAMEFAPHHIRINGIAPGYTEEDEHGQPIPHGKTPLGGTSAKPEVIARAAVYLASEYFSKHTTGSILKIDGGLALHNHVTMPSPPPPLWRKVTGKLRRLASGGRR